MLVSYFVKPTSLVGKFFQTKYELHKIEKLILNAVIISSSIIKALPFITLSEDYLIMTNKEVLANQDILFQY